jgi:hypothetical protein
LVCRDTRSHRAIVVDHGTTQHQGLENMRLPYFLRVEYPIPSVRYRSWIQESREKQYRRAGRSSGVQVSSEKREHS